MKITRIQITGLAGGTVEGGWADELKPEDDVHTIVEVLTDEGLSGVGSIYTSKSLVEGAVKLLSPLFIGERADEPDHLAVRAHHRARLEAEPDGMPCRGAQPEVLEQATAALLDRAVERGAKAIAVERMEHVNPLCRRAI